MDALSLIDSWPVNNVAAAITRPNGTTTTRGDASRLFRLASISKIITTWATLVAVEEGSIGLDSPVGQPGCTLRHLLSHAGGYAFDGVEPISTPGKRRIYSNTGIELAADAVAQATDMPFARYLSEAVLEPLQLTHTELQGSPAHGIWSTVADMTLLLAELASATILAPSTVADATTTQFPNLNGVVPGVGTCRPCPWGLGAELHGLKSPHWMGTNNSPETFGHFGGAGTMMWIDPVAGVSVIALTDRLFDEWATDALRLWPEFSDAALAET